MSEEDEDSAVTMRALTAMPLCHPLVLRYKSTGKIAVKWCKACNSFLERVEGDSPCPVIALRSKLAPIIFAGDTE